MHDGTSRIHSSNSPLFSDESSVWAEFSSTPDFEDASVDGEERFLTLNLFNSGTTPNLSNVLSKVMRSSIPKAPSLSVSKRFKSASAKSFQLGLLNLAIKKLILGCAI